MPCDTISSVNVDLSGAKMNADLLHRALVSLGVNPLRNGSLIEFDGYRSSYNVETRQLSLRERRGGVTEANIRQAYGAEVVKDQARRYGWTLRQTAPYKYEVIKR